MRFKVNTPPVIHQTLDGEVIVVNLDTGTYYSLAGSSAEIWTAVEQGSSVDETVEATLGRYDGSRAEVEPAVREFIDELVSEELIAPSELAPPAAANRTNHANGTGTTLPFVPPRLDKYVDMQELLMLDPIHEVDERGWPHSAGNGETAAGLENAVRAAGGRRHERRGVLPGAAVGMEERGRARPPVESLTYAVAGLAFEPAPWRSRRCSTRSSKPG